MENQPLVTVYTITRNRADLISRAITSVLYQSYKNIDYLIIDSASTDNTEEVVKQFDDRRIRYIKLEENATFGACVNMAFDLAKGKYVTELDDDDEYRLDKIEKQVQLFESLPEDYGMVYCWMTYFDNVTHQQLEIHKAELRGFIADDVIATQNVSGTPTLLVRKSIFKEIGGYKEAKEIGVESDWEFAARICQHYKVDYVPESLVNIYINHSHQRMSDSSYYKEFWKKRVFFHKYFLNEFKEGFERHTKHKCPHLLRISVFSWRSRNYCDFVKYAGLYIYYKIFGSK